MNVKLCATNKIQSGSTTSRPCYYVRCGPSTDAKWNDWIIFFSLFLFFDFQIENFLIFSYMKMKCERAVRCLTQFELALLLSFFIFNKVDTFIVKRVFHFTFIGVCDLATSFITLSMAALHLIERAKRNFYVFFLLVDTSEYGRESLFHFESNVLWMFWRNCDTNLYDVYMSAQSMKYASSLVAYHFYCHKVSALIQPLQRCVTFVFTFCELIFSIANSKN